MYEVRKLDCILRKLGLGAPSDWREEKASNIFCQLEEGSGILFCSERQKCLL